jgi:hypothetical protein
VLATKMASRWRVWCGAVGALGLAGCQADYRVTPVVNTSEPKALEWEIEADSFGHGSIRVLNPYTYNPAQETQGRRTSESSITDQPPPKPGEHDTLTPVDPGDLRTHSLYEIAINPAVFMTQRQEARNELVNAILRVSDENAAAHLAGLKATQSNINIFLGAAALGLSGAGAAVSESAQALSAASTGVQGTRTLINDEVYSQALAESIITLVTADRKAQADAIRKRYAEDLSLFPVEEAIAAAVRYHETASVYNGLALARQAIEKDAIRKRDDKPDRTTSLPDSIKAAESDLEDAKRKLTNVSQSVVTTDAELNKVKEQLKATDLIPAAKLDLEQKKQRLEQEKARLDASKAGMQRVVQEQEKELAARQKALSDQLKTDAQNHSNNAGSSQGNPAEPDPAGTK